MQEEIKKNVYNAVFLIVDWGPVQQVLRCDCVESAMLQSWFQEISMLLLRMLSEMIQASSN